MMASTRCGIVSERCSRCRSSNSSHVYCAVATIISFVVSLFRICRRSGRSSYIFAFNNAQRFSIGFKSGECGGHSNCPRARRRFHVAVSTRGRKNRCSPILSPDFRSNRTSRNSTQCASLGKAKADM